MPEIKHQFTSGKMNKDLDERLVPNGEYRDAMNIQVSTSEDSEVGTIQNILGNSLVPGQSFISKDAYCVGSIADEKNDKLYYFIDNSIEMIPNTKLEDDSDWMVAGTAVITPNYEGDGVLLTTAGDQPGAGNYPGWRNTVPMELVDGKNYKLDVSFKNVNDGGTVKSKYFIYGINSISTGHYRPLTGNNVTPGGNAAIEGNFNYTHDFKFDQSLNDNETTVKFNVELFDGDDYAKKVRVTNISFKQKGACIIEYDAKNNSITPVLIDDTGDVLSFSRNKLITGINIIDDMLFWTDNHTEPKKINIPRSIEGTDSSGLIHSNFVNEQTGITTPIKEEHITVIKKSPKQAPGISLIQQRNPNYTYSALTKITSELNEANSNIIGSNYDFSTFSVGSEFEMELPTDINSNSGFTLQWNVGDILAIKTFTGEFFDEIPSIPLRDYNIKAEIISSNNNNFTDLPLEQILNSNFETPNSDGTNAAGFTWDFNSSDYNSIDQTIEVNSSGWAKMGYGGLSLTPDSTYKLEFKINNVIEGGIDAWLIVPGQDLNPMASSDDLYAFRATGTPGVINSGGYATSDGVYSILFTLSAAQRTNTFTAGNGIASSAFVSAGNLVLFQTQGPTAQQSKLDIDYVSLQKIDASNAQCKVKILSIPEPPTTVPEGFNEIQCVVDRLENNDKIFEFKFPRIAYRYRYQDNEYSAISPFSQVAFAPGAFNYHPKEGYNLGMANRIKQIDISNLNANIPDGVTEIDIVYKEETSTNLYVVDTIKPNNNNISGFSDFWIDGKYTIKSEQIYKAISSNQILRPWDNVPKTALAQEIVGNRVVYANYTQGFDLKFNQEDYYPDFDFYVSSVDVNNITLPSVKSLREYQIGAVFVDEYGRETPVVTSPNSFVKINKENSNTQNKLEVSFHNEKYPDSLKYIKFFVKETSGEYYNLAMDRWYNAEDSQIWLSFPSSDRNKIDIDDFLILKKGVERDELVKDEAKYKVLDIQNEAPDFIKQKYNLIESLQHNADTASLGAIANIFNSSDNLPISGEQSFQMDYELFANSLSKDLENESDNHELYIEFIDKNTSEASERYKINKVSSDFSSVGLADAQYTIMLDRVLGDDVNFISNDITGANPTSVKDGISVQIYIYEEVKQTAKFDGKFFVKINTNAAIDSNIFISSMLSGSTQYRLKSNNHIKRLYSLDTNLNNTHSKELTGQTLGKYKDGFGRFACYFRNYASIPGAVSMEDTNNTDYDVSPYMFGDGAVVDGSNNTYFLQRTTTNHWQNELAYITAGKDHGHGWTAYNSWTNTNEHNHARLADSHAWTKEERVNNTVWFIDKGNFEGTRWDRDMHSKLQFGSSHINATQGSASGISSNASKVFFDIGIGGILRPSEYAEEGGQNVIQKIYHSWDDDDNKIIENHWNVGEYGGNNNYSTQQNIDIVTSLYKNNKFRFREDPTHQVYTTVEDPSMYGRLRYDAGVSPSGSQPGGWLWANVLEADTNNPDSTALANEVEEAWSGGSTYTYSHWKPNITKRTAQLSPNYTSNFKLKTVNSTNTSPNVIPWNPAGPLGPIPNGLKLTTSHSSFSSSSDPTAPKADYSASGSEIYICVDSLVATNHDGTSHTIKERMILTSHSGSDLLAGATDDKVELLIWKIEDVGSFYKLFLCGYRFPLNISGSTFTSGTLSILEHDIRSNLPTSGGAMTFEQPAMNGYTQYSCNRINAQDAMNHGYDLHDPDSKIWGTPGIMPVYYHLEFIQEIDREADLPSNPAIWETEPKKSTDLDIYYEASGYNPLYLDQQTKHIAIPNFSSVAHKENPTSIVSGFVHSVDYYDGPTAGYTDNNGDLHGGVVGTAGWYVQIVVKDDVLVGSQYINIGDILNITKPDGSVISVTVTGWYGALNNHPDFIFISDKLYGPDTKYTLGWYNCFAFGNGVESNRIRDNFNLPFINNGVKASTTLEFSNYKEEHRKYGLIYSGLYNANSGINNLNQFIAAEKITKDINPTYGSIQKLFTRDTDLITLCEDKVLQILASKDAVFNADGDPQLVATNRVLGQSRPFVGEYGISTNPESFASESYRAYFADKVRGAIIRLSKDGLTPISDHGMKDWFKDNLSLGTTNLLGENNLSSQDKWDIPSNGNSAIVNDEAILGYYNDPLNFTAGKSYRSAKLRMENVLEIGKTYRVQFDVIEHSGLTNLNPSSGVYRGITVVNTHPASGWQAGFVEQGKVDGDRVEATWVANRNDFELLQYQVSTGTPPTYDGIPTMDYVNALGGDWISNGHFYGGIVKIKNIVLTEVKEEELKVTGSYDDKKDEYNVTVHSTIPSTVSFKESSKGWVSFKSFIPENGLSCANNYYTLKDGKLWQHHNPGVNRNTFYNEFTNSSFVTLLNDMPSVIKSFKTLEYEGSQSNTIGVKHVDVNSIVYTGPGGSQPDGKYFYCDNEEYSKLRDMIHPNEMDPNYEGVWYDGKFTTSMVTVKQYNVFGILKRTGNIKIWYDPSIDNLHGRWNGGGGGYGQAGDWVVGDFITTQIQEDVTVDWNVKPKDGWYVSEVETNKEKGSLQEFIEKEGKWFNYIQGVDNIGSSTINPEIFLGTSDIFNSSSNNLASLEVQGLGTVLNTSWLPIPNDFLYEIEMTNEIPNTFSVGDRIFALGQGGASDIDLSKVIAGTDFYYAGTVVSISGNKFVISDEFGMGGNEATEGGYLIFVKNQIVNTSSLSGYYMEAKFENNSKEKAELFAVSSEVTESSK